MRMRRPEESERDLRRCRTDLTRVLGKDWCKKPRGFPPEFTKTVHNDPHLKRFLSSPMLVLLKIGGNCSCVRAKPAHFVGHLPVHSEEADPLCGSFPEFVLIFALNLCSFP